MRGADRFGAFVAVRPDASFRAEGPLCGAWVAVKDNISVSGLPFTAGLPAFSERIAAEDAEAVQRLRHAGGRVAGVTHTDAGGFGVTTPAVTNPTWPGRIVGGSSGGSAAAVAAGIADIGLGTDTGGSIRIPAACCGLYAFKPTHDRVPLTGIWPMAPRFDHVGLMTRTFGALARAATALLQAPMPETSTQTRALRFGVDMTRIFRLAPEVAESFLAVLERLRRDGCVIEPIHLPDQDTVREIHGVLTLAEARSIYDDLPQMAPADLGSLAGRVLSIASLQDQAAVAHAETVAARIIESCKRTLGDIDAVLGPTLPVETPQAGAHRVMLNGRMVPTINALMTQTCLANITGGPALVVPWPGMGRDSPGSLQLMGLRNTDALLIGHGARLAELSSASAGDSGARIAQSQPRVFTQ